MVGISQQEIVWRKSSHSAADGECVEIAHIDSHILVRDSKHRNSPILVLKINSWASLIESIKTGHLDRELARLQEWPRRENDPVGVRGEVTAPNPGATCLEGPGTGGCRGLPHPGERRSRCSGLPSAYRGRYPLVRQLFLVMPRMRSRAAGRTVVALKPCIEFYQRSQSEQSDTEQDSHVRQVAN